MAEASASVPIIQIDGLTKTYGAGADAVSALRGVDLSIRRGQIFGIIGMSGAGKSTLIRCINLLDKPTSGTIFFDGVDITTLPDKELRSMRRQVGMVFQQFNLLMQRTVIRNICFPMEIAGVPKAKALARARELLEIVGLSDKAQAFPAQLSGGQKQRVAIARALATSPKLLLCDEATSALDPMTTRSILELLQDINRRLGITILIITHEMQVVRQICTHIAVLDGGRVAESGAVEELFSRPQTQAGMRLFAGDREGNVLAEAEIKAVRGTLVRVVFDGGAAYEPVISKLILSLGAPLNILSADIQTVAGKQHGQMFFSLNDPEMGEKAIAYLRGHGLTAEEVRS